MESTTNLRDWSVISTNPGVVGGTVTVPEPRSTTEPNPFLRLRVIK